MPYSLRQFFVALPFKLGEEDNIKHMAWSLCLTKEWRDKYFGSGFCFYDMTGNLIGSLAGLLCGFLLRIVPMAFLSLS